MMRALGVCTAVVLVGFFTLLVQTAVNAQNCPLQPQPALDLGSFFPPCINCTSPFTDPISLCNDGVICTQDTCDSAVARCIHTPRNYCNFTYTNVLNGTCVEYPPLPTVPLGGICLLTFNNITNTFSYTNDCPSPLLVDRIVEPTCVDQCQSFTGSCAQCLAVSFGCRYCKSTGACFNASVSPAACSAPSTITSAINCPCTQFSYNQTRQRVALTQTVPSPFAQQTLVRQSVSNTSHSIMVRIEIAPGIVQNSRFDATVRVYRQTALNVPFALIQTILQSTTSGFGAPYMYDFERDRLVTANIGHQNNFLGNRSWQVWERNVTTGLLTLKYTDTPTNAVGTAIQDISISSETAQTIAIAFSSGSVGIYERNATTSQWRLLQFLQQAVSAVEFVADRKLITFRSTGGIRVYTRAGIGANFTLLQNIAVPSSVVGSLSTLTSEANTILVRATSSVNGQPRVYAFRAPSDFGNYSLVQEFTISGTNAQYSLIPVFNYGRVITISRDERFVAISIEGGPTVPPDTGAGGWIIYEKLSPSGIYLQRGYTPFSGVPVFTVPNLFWCTVTPAGCTVAHFEASFHNARFYTGTTVNVREYILNGTARTTCCTTDASCPSAAEVSCAVLSCVNATYCNVSAAASKCGGGIACANYTCNLTTGCVLLASSNVSCQPLIDANAAPCVTGGQTCDATCGCKTTEDLSCATSPCSVFTGCHSCTLAVFNRCGWCASTHTCVDRFTQNCTAGTPRINCTTTQDQCGIVNGYSGEKYFQITRAAGFPLVNGGIRIKAYENATLGIRFIVTSDATLNGGFFNGFNAGRLAIYRQNMSTSAISQINVQTGTSGCRMLGYEFDIKNMIIAILDMPSGGFTSTIQTTGRVHIFEYDTGAANFVFRVSFTYCTDTLHGYVISGACPNGCGGGGGDCPSAYVSRGMTLSDDGQTLYVRGQTTCGTTTGARDTVSVLVFQRNASNPLAPWPLVSSILHPDPVFSSILLFKHSQFGHEIVIREPYVFVTDPAPSALTQVGRHGIVYVYLKSGLTYTLIQRILPPGSLVCNTPASTSSQFGFKIDQRGLFLAVSARDASVENNGATGEVYIYRRTNATDPTYRYMQKLRVHANNSLQTPANARFGMYLSLSVTSPQRLVVGFDQAASTLFRDLHWRGGYIVYQFNASRDAFQADGALMDRLQAPIGPSTLHTQQTSNSQLYLRDNFYYNGRYYIPSTVSGTGSGNFIESYALDASIGALSCCFQNSECVDAFACTTNEQCIPGVGCNRTLNNATCAVPLSTCKVGVCSATSGCVNVSLPNGAPCGGGFVCQSGVCVQNTSCLTIYSNCNNTANGVLPCVNQTCDYALGCRDITVNSCDIACSSLIGCRQCLAATPNCGFCANTGTCVNLTTTPVCPVNATTPVTTCATVDPLCVPTGGVGNAPLQNIDDFTLIGNGLRFRILDAELDLQPTGGQSLLVAISDSSAVNASIFPTTNSGVRVYRRAGPPGTPFALFRQFNALASDVVTLTTCDIYSNGGQICASPTLANRRIGYALELESNVLAFLRGVTGTGVCEDCCQGYYCFPYFCSSGTAACLGQPDANLRTLFIARKIATLDTFSQNCSADFYPSRQFGDINSLELTRDGAFAIIPGQTQNAAGACNATGTRIFVVNTTTCAEFQQITSPQPVVCNLATSVNTQWGANVETGSNCLLVVSDHRPAASVDPLRKGRVYVYSRCSPGPTYTLVQTVNAPQSVPANGEFGFTVDAGSDNFFVACAVGNRRCYAFRNVSGSFALVQEFYTTGWLSNFGDDIAVAKDDTSFAVRVTSATANTIDPLQTGQVVVWVFNATLNRYVLRGSTVLFKDLPVSQVASQSSGLTGGFNIANNSVMVNTFRTAGNAPRFDQHVISSDTVASCCNVSNPVCVIQSPIPCQPTGVCTPLPGGGAFCDPTPNNSLCNDNIPCTSDVCVKNIGCVLTASNATCTAVIAPYISGTCVTGQCFGAGCAYSSNASCAQNCSSLTGQGCWQCLGAPMGCKYCPSTKQCLSLTSTSVCNDSSIPVNTTCANTPDDCGVQGGFSHSAYPLVNSATTGAGVVTDGTYVFRGTIPSFGFIQPTIYARDSAQEDAYVIVQTLNVVTPVVGTFGAWRAMRNKVLLASPNTAPLRLNVYINVNIFLAPFVLFGTIPFNQSRASGYDFTYDAEVLYLTHMRHPSNLTSHGVYVYRRDPFNVFALATVLFSPDNRPGGLFGVTVKADRNPIHGRVAILDPTNNQTSPTCPSRNCPRLYLYQRVFPINDGSHVPLQIIESPVEARTTQWGREMALANQILVVCGATTATEPSGVVNAGRCYVYYDTLDDGNYLLIQVLRAVDLYTPNTLAANAFFGTSVAISIDNLDLGITGIAPKTYYGTVRVVHMFKWSQSLLRFIYKGALIRDDAPSFASNLRIDRILDFYDNITTAPHAPMRHAFSTAFDGAFGANDVLVEHCIGCDRNCCVTNLRCRDAVACTANECIIDVGCSNPPDDALCNDFRTCTSEYCNATIGCVYNEDDAFCQQSNDNVDCQRAFCSATLSSAHTNGCVNADVPDGYLCDDRCHLTSGDRCIDGGCAPAVFSVSNCTNSSQCVPASNASCVIGACIANKCVCLLNGTSCVASGTCGTAQCIPTAVTANATSGCVERALDTLCANVTLVNQTDCKRPVCNITTRNCYLSAITNIDGTQFLRSDLPNGVETFTDSDGTKSWFGQSWTDVGIPGNFFFNGGRLFASPQSSPSVFNTKCVSGFKRALPLLPSTEQYQTLTLVPDLQFPEQLGIFSPPECVNVPALPAMIVEVSRDGFNFEYLGCIGGEGGGPCGTPPFADCQSGLTEYTYDISFINANATNPTIRFMNGLMPTGCVISGGESGPTYVAANIRIQEIVVDITAGCNKNESCASSQCIDGFCTIVSRTDFVSYRDQVITSSYSNTQGVSLNWMAIGSWTENLENPGTPFNSPFAGNLRADQARGLLLGRMTTPAFTNQNLMRSIPVPITGSFGSVAATMNIRPRVHTTALEVRYTNSGAWTGVYCVEGSDPLASGTCLAAFGGSVPSMSVPINGNTATVSAPLNANLVGSQTAIRLRSIFLSATVSLANAAEVRVVEIGFSHRTCNGANKCYHNRCDNGTCMLTNVSVTCFDNKPCTNDTCINATGCSFPLTPGFACNVPGLNAACTLPGSCNATGSCVNFTINATNPCNQSNLCRINTTCGADGLCSVFQNRTCTDFDNCTIDQCSPEFGCVTSPIATSDGFTCTVDSCASPLGTVVNTPNNSLCPLAQYRCVRAVCNVSDPNRDGDGCLYTFNTSFCRATRPTCNRAVCNPLDFNADADGCVDVLNSTTCARSIPCQIDSCSPSAPLANATTGCLHVPNNAACSDNIPCTNDTCIVNVGCTNVPVNSSCLPAAPCGFYSCVAGVGCVLTVRNLSLCTSGTQCERSTCSPGAPGADANGCLIVLNNTYCQALPRPSCSQRQCDPNGMGADPTTGCTLTFVSSGVACDDSNLCTLNDVCINGTCIGTPRNCTTALFCTLNNTCNPATGQCVAGARPRCNDSKLCTADSCNETANTCTFTPNNTYCSILLNPDPQCQFALCNGSSPTGCTLNNRPNGLVCNDTNPSTSFDACLNGVCVGVPNNCTTNTTCNDMRNCTFDFCNTTSFTCQFVPNNTYCQATQVVEPQCQNAYCNGSSPTGCTLINVPDNTSCTDGNATTFGDRCIGGRCVGFVQCVPNCTVQLFCTLNNTCVNGTCVAGPTLRCFDNKTCTADVCNATARTCTFVPNNTICTQLLTPFQQQCQLAVCNGSSPTGCAIFNRADGLLCNDTNPMTLMDHCVSGQCVGIPKNCTTDANCSDMRSCTRDLCNMTSFTCYSVPNNTACTVLLTPNEQQCQVAACNVTGSMPTGCMYSNLPNGLACNDTNASTTFDACLNGVCVGVPRNCTTNASCSDNRTCTIDICNATANRCVYTRNDSYCTATLVVEPQCQQAFCNGTAPTGCTLFNSPNGTSCDDNNATTQMDRCINGRCVGTPPCLNKLVGELCPGGFCYLNTCIPCPLNNSCTGMQLNASCWLISSLVCNRLARDLLSVSMCLNGAYAPNGSFVGPTMTLATAMSSPFFSGTTVGQALSTAQQLVSTNALTIVNAQNCTQLIRFLTDMANVTGIYRAFQAATCPNSLFAITQAATWPGRGGGPGCGAGCGCGFGTWANEDLSSASDRDYNDNDYRVRIITGQDSLGRYAGTLIEKIPVTLGTFYTHRVQFHPNGVPAAPTRLVTTSAPYLSGVGRVISRRFNTASYVFSPTTQSTTHAQVHTLYTDTRAEQALQTGVVSLSNRIINTCAAKTLLLQAGSFVTISAASRAANPVPKAPNPYDTPLLLVLKVTTVASAEVTPPRFNATGHAVTKLDCLPGTGEFNSLWIDRVNWRWPKESVKLATMCPQFAQCVQCVCGSAPSGTCRSVCENFAFNCTQSAPLAC